MHYCDRKNTAPHNWYNMNLVECLRLHHHFQRSAGRGDGFNCSHQAVGFQSSTGSDEGVLVVGRNEGIKGMTNLTAQASLRPCFQQLEHQTTRILPKKQFHGRKNPGRLSACLQ